jgi:hypothetical protein
MKNISGKIVTFAIVIASSALLAWTLPLLTYVAFKS